MNSKSWFLKFQHQNMGILGELAFTIFLEEASCTHFWVTQLTCLGSVNQLASTNNSTLAALASAHLVCVAAHERQS